MQSLNGPSRAEPATILYCLIWDSPNPEGQVPVFISRRNRVAQLYPRAQGHANVYENWDRTSQETHCVSATKSKRFMLSIGLWRKQMISSSQNLLLTIGLSIKKPVSRKAPCLNTYSLLFASVCGSAVPFGYPCVIWTLMFKELDAHRKWPFDVKQNKTQGWTESQTCVSVSLVSNTCIQCVQSLWNARRQ
jgi:hypothetical protein